MNNNKNLVTVTANRLLKGDTLAGSGFVVTNNAWAGVRTPKRKVNVEGFYPEGAITLNHWNAGTRVQVLR